ncbi:unnamed protein product [Timema podura]|uniref:Uncharacterized protein n=1 Tax=Timema podura TaxID=61482 RepID=A0ABN7PNQ0_TIMPD|nr:unnamed protein product [Timema podura]
MWITNGGVANWSSSTILEGWPIGRSSSTIFWKVCQLVDPAIMTTWKGKNTGNVARLDLVNPPRWRSWLTR